jgi:hypothetical protein
MFQYQPPRYNVDSDPFQSGFNALSQGLGDWNTAVAAQRKREQGLRVTNALAQKDYTGAMQATDNPELAMGIQRQVDGRAETAEARAFRERQFMLQQQEAARQGNQWNQKFALERPAMEADLALKQAQARALGQKDEFRAGMTRMLFGDEQPGQPPVPQQGGVQPQSNNAPPSVPGVVLAQSGPPQLGPQQNGPQPTEPTVDVFGRKLPIAQARKLAQSMLLNPEYAPLGKSILDSIPAAGGAIGKEGQNELDKKQIAGADQIGRLRTIESSFKPEFLQIETRMGLRFNELVDSFRAGKLAPEAQQQLGEYAAFRSDSLNNLNQYIKEITGAAMSVAEADRIKKVMPNPGEGVFDGDSPTVFKSKLDQALRSTKLAMARASYLHKNGFNGTADEAAARVPLDRMNNIMQERARQLRQEAVAKMPGLDDSAIRPLVAQRLRAEFGSDI